MTDNMDTSQNQNTGVTDQTDDKNETQATSGKSFTQEELNAIVAKRVAQEQKKFEGVDLDEYKTLKQRQEEIEQEKLMKREEFDKVLKSTKEKYESEVTKLRTELEKTKIDGTLKSVAGKLKTANPDHVAALLRAQVKLDDSGQPVVVDNEGNVRYNSDTAEQFTIEDLVNEFVGQNPYFKAAGRTGTGGDGNRGNVQHQEFDITQLDMTKKADREKYAQLKKEGKIRSF